MFFWRFRTFEKPLKNHPRNINKNICTRNRALAENFWKMSSFKTFLNVIVNVLSKFLLVVFSLVFFCCLPFHPLQLSPLPLLCCLPPSPWGDDVLFFHKKLEMKLNKKSCELHKVKLNKIVQWSGGCLCLSSSVKVLFSLALLGDVDFPSFLLGGTVLSPPAFGWCCFLLLLVVLSFPHPLPPLGGAAFSPPFGWCCFPAPPSFRCCCWLTSWWCCRPLTSLGWCCFLSSFLLLGGAAWPPPSGGLVFLRLLGVVLPFPIIFCYENKFNMQLSLIDSNLGKIEISKVNWSNVVVVLAFVLLGGAAFPSLCSIAFGPSPKNMY